MTRTAPRGTAYTPSSAVLAKHKQSKYTTKSDKLLSAATDALNALAEWKGDFEPQALGALHDAYSRAASVHKPPTRKKKGPRTPTEELNELQQLSSQLSASSASVQHAEMKVLRTEL